jgi:hypothetical protein
MVSIEVLTKGYTEYISAITFFAKKRKRGAIKNLLSGRCIANTRSYVLASEFERKYFQQAYYWIGGLEFNVMKSELVLSLISDPETSVIDGVFTFNKITDYQGQFDIEDYDPECTECLIGIETQVSEKTIKYCINFGIGEVLFSSTEEPGVKWRDPKGR